MSPKPSAMLCRHVSPQLQDSGWLASAKHTGDPSITQLPGEDKACEAPRRRQRARSAEDEAMVEKDTEREREKRKREHHLRTHRKKLVD